MSEEPSRRDILVITAKAALGLTAGLTLPSILTSKEETDLQNVDDYIYKLYQSTETNMEYYEQIAERLANKLKTSPSTNYEKITIDWTPGIDQGISQNGISVEYEEGGIKYYALDTRGSMPQRIEIYADDFSKKYTNFKSHHQPSMKVSVVGKPDVLKYELTSEDEIIIPKDTTYNTDVSVAVRPSANGEISKVTTGILRFWLNESPKNWQVQKRTMHELIDGKIQTRDSTAQFFVNGNPTEISDSFMQETLDTLIPLNSPSN